jgi:3-hydroxybutyryl-CoA dehydrogenase
MISLGIFYYIFIKHKYIFYQQPIFAKILLMKIVVIANDYAWKELTENSSGIEWFRAMNSGIFFEHSDAAAFFDLSDDAFTKDYSNIQQPVFINCVTGTLKEISAGKNILRINGWKGFIKRDTWEASGNPSDQHRAIITALNKKLIVVPDEPGFISARIISMIINEAFYAKGERVSTENEIDIAMKLGTNYPYGPFEWSREIGVQHVYQLLLTLSKTDNRYKPSPLLEQEAKKI